MPKGSLRKCKSSPFKAQATHEDESNSGVGLHEFTLSPPFGVSYSKVN